MRHPAAPRAFGLSRRRFLTISAAAAMAGPAAAAASARWSGHAMGAPVSLQLAGVPEPEARRIWHAVDRELARLERIFSLYQPDSQLARLNQAGLLAAPAPELREVLGLCDTLYRATGGAFDPTVQPLWRLRAETAAAGRQPSADELRRARDLLGWADVLDDGDAIRLARPGMALTLNGIAQGYVTDRIAGLLAGQGLQGILIDMGEIAARGTRADGQDWQAGIATPEGRIVARVVLRDRALATSAPLGTVLDARGATGHILDPRQPERAPPRALVAVSAGRAAVADGLSTAGCLLSEPELMQAMIAFSDAKLETAV